MSTPKFLGPYRIGETLGRGGMGSVFKAIHEKSGDEVAVKLISSNLADEMRFRRRFNAEVETLKRLRHEGIVSMIGYGEQDGQLFYSMELVDGEPLQKYIRRSKRLDWNETIDFSIQICAALKHAHDIGVIHRDLKPANLMLTKDKKIKLVDFGIAKLFGFGEQTLAGSILGTADYMAPEQATNSGITLRTDLYALGSVMYAMLAGRPPFKGKRITQVIDALKREKPVPLDMVNPDLPEALVELAHQLLEKNPMDRPPTALATMNRLKAMRAGLLKQQTMTGKGSTTSDNAIVRPSGHTAGSDSWSGDHEHETTDEPPTGRRTRPSSDEARQGQTANVPVPGKNDATIVGARLNTVKTVNESSTSDDTPSGRNTHFQTVDQSSGESGVFRHEDPTPPSSWVQGLSIALILAALAFGAFLVYVGGKNPSADELYDEIVSITATQRMAEARPQIDKFMKLFPEDERFDEVKVMDISLQFSGVVRRLQLQSKLPGKTLDAHEQAFLSAIELRDQDSEAARKKLAQWLDVFVDSTTHADDERKEMAELVQFEIERLDRRGPVLSNDNRGRELMARIRTAEELEPEEREALLKGIVDLYSSESWAEAAVTAAKERLAEEAQSPGQAQVNDE